MSFLKGMSQPREPTEEAGSSIQFQALPKALSREGGPIVRPETHSLPRNPSRGEDSSAGTEAWLLPEIHMGEEGPGIKKEAGLVPLEDKGLPQFNFLPLQHEVFCSPAWVCLPKGGNLPQEGLYHDHYYYHFYYSEDLGLDLDLFSYH